MTYVIVTKNGEVSVIHKDTMKEALHEYFVTISSNGLHDGYSIYPVTHEV